MVSVSRAFLSCSFFQWEELQGEFEQLDYLRGLVYGELGEESSKMDHPYEQKYEESSSIVSSL